MSPSVERMPEGDARAAAFYERAGWMPGGGTKSDRRPGSCSASAGT